MLLSATSIIGDNVRNGAGEDLGKIEDLMVCTVNGSVKYAVLSFGGFLGMGDKLFAVPLETLTLNTAEKCFVMNVTKERLENAPGFDKDNWPDTASVEWQESISNYYIP
ncbi:PRC-barrel domain-containing protein [Candidatus Nitrotoga sp. M5]|uniref:PRC-barrel domain-containing protein n=1 Tax=Candidatus Nitrotoga sp. M5 TaxID=2890409 RepID=UPI001EF334C2|nr:PRC-barrel domain-containing protein [Candidatus Nitrotoga sp. M5]CAH1386944.1 Photosystem reaction center subunit H [Candidatus Nitrotoga sp. M5]